MRLPFVGLLTVGLLAAAPLAAERYALLVGVGQYRMGNDLRLEGPPFDIEALRHILLGSYGYGPLNVTVLLNKQATHEAILKALDQRVSGMKRGDELLFYFSGHGTSAFDESTAPLHQVIGPDSGALAPNDLSYTDVPAAIHSIIIGHRDLRPILSRVPAGAHALVLLDACYAENSFKASGSLAGAPARGFDLMSRIPDAPRSLKVPTAPPNEDASYPYSNVVAIVAASRTQTAIDIGDSLIGIGWRTFDGKPHGAFSNSLLAGLSGSGDTNGDGRITYDELFRFIRQDMDRLPHQPQMLSPEDFSLDQTAFANAPLPPKQTLAPETNPERVLLALQKIDSSLRASLKAKSGIRVTDAEYDYLLSGKSTGWALYDPAGAIIESFGASQSALIPDRVLARAQLDVLRVWSNPKQRFNVRIDAQPAGATGYNKLRTNFRVDDRVTFRIGSDQAAYLLLLAIDKTGRISIVFPVNAQEREQQPARHPIEFTTRATPPAGTDYLKLIAFPHAPAHWSDWACGAERHNSACLEFGTGDPAFQRLKQLLDQSAGAAESRLRVQITE